MSSTAPSHTGRWPLMAMLTRPSTRLNMPTLNMPWRIRVPALRKSFAPQACATCTEKPVATAIPKPLTIHVVVDTSPTDAAWLDPRRPTMAESMYCMRTDDSCARIAGMARRRVR